MYVCYVTAHHVSFVQCLAAHVRRLVVVKRASKLVVNVSDDRHTVAHAPNNKHPDGSAHVAVVLCKHHPCACSVSQLCTLPTGRLFVGV